MRMDYPAERCNGVVYSISTCDTSRVNSALCPISGAPAGHTSCSSVTRVPFSLPDEEVQTQLRRNGEVA